jgi:alanine racemase
MNSTGINIKDIDKYIDLIKNSNLVLEGVYTHLSSADNDEEYTKRQLDIFKKAVSILNKNFDSIKYIHSSSSNGLLNYDDGVSNAVRPGLVMYGYETFPGMYKKIDVKPTTKLVSTITFLKEIDEGESVSYSRRFKALRKTKVATVPLGYADGIRRDLSNKGYVLINGKKAKIIGSVCMDSFMCDVTSIKDVKVGDTVYIWDNKEITLEDIANLCNTINYEILSTISSRVPRV